MKIQATIDGGDGSARIEWSSGFATVDGGGEKTRDLLANLRSGTISSYLPGRGGYSGFNFDDPEELRDALEHARRRGHKVEVLRDEVPIKPAPPAGVPLDRERQQALRRRR